METSIQLALEFPSSPPESRSAPGVPLDHAFPSEEANELAHIESFNKHLYRPNTYLHKWWARRSGTTFRYILKQLVNDPAKAAFYEPGGLEGTTILDPMMGGGTILHEAIRMGANVVGVDIDPIPVLQAKASLNLIPLPQKRAVFREFFSALRATLAPLYRTSCPLCQGDAETQFILYGLRRRCSCREVLFVDSFLLRENEHHDTYICPQCQSVYTGLAHVCEAKTDTLLVEKGTRSCEECGSAFVDITDEPFSGRYVPLVIVAKCPAHGQFFKTVQQADLDLLNRSRTLAQDVDLGDERHFRIRNGPKSGDLLRRGVRSYLELFTSRQLLYLNLSVELLSRIPAEDRLWLSLLVSTSLEFNSLLCGYKGKSIRRPGAVRHVFSHHAYSFPYTALENNPIFSGRGSGTLNQLFHDRILRAGKWALSPTEVLISDSRRTKVHIGGEIDGGKAVSDWESLSSKERRFLVLQADSARLEVPEASVDYVVTDPPYFDSVQYSDLSSFFRVWLRLFLPHEVNWVYDPLESAVSEGKSASGLKYGEALEGIWKTCSRALRKERGRLIFTFHHWKHEAWAELTLSLKRAGFVLVNRYVVFSENPSSVHIRGVNSLKHDTILVLRPSMAIKEDSPEWPVPTRIDTTDSRAFCQDCGAALGWFLANDVGEGYIRRHWKALLEGTDDGEAS